MLYKPVIGLEIHAELNTVTKMFCDSLNDPDEKHPNINICPVCMGHPGTLPVINEEAIKKVIMAGLALNCKIAEDTFFERKQYFYPDLPKGYQISQYQKPMCYEGWLDLRSASANSQETVDSSKNLSSHSPLSIVRKQIRITRIHLEEDAGRLYHLPDKDYSLVDYNRAGVPLMELVTEPDFESGQEVKDFVTELQLIWQYLGVSNANMEKGEMRVEVNISLSVDGQETIDNRKILENYQPSAIVNKHILGTKVEIKNLNSIKFAADAVDYEIKRQTELLEAGEKIKQETRGWDENKKQTFSQRSKEEAHDYRYFPEPDLPPIKLSSLNLDNKVQTRTIKAEMPELPRQRGERFKKQYNLPDNDIELFVSNKILGNYFEHVASELLSFDPEKFHFGDSKLTPEHNTRLFKLAANYLITEIKRMADEVDAEVSDTKITPDMLADLVVRIFHGQVSSSGAQTILKEMFFTGNSPEQVIKEKDLEQVSSASELEQAVIKVVADNPKAVQDYKNGKESSLHFLVGMMMKETRGKANTTVVAGILKEMLK